MIERTFLRAYLKILYFFFFQLFKGIREKENLKLISQFLYKYLGLKASFQQLAVSVCRFSASKYAAIKC